MIYDIPPWTPDYDRWKTAGPDDEDDDEFGEDDDL